MSVTFNDDVTALFQQAARNVPQAQRAAVRKGARMVKDEAYKRAQAIDRRSIPKSKTGKPKWTRTGKLKAGIVVEETGPASALVTVRGPAEKYAERREGLGVDWTPRNPAGGVIRRDPFMREAADAVANKLPDEVAAEFVNRLTV